MRREPSIEPPVFMTVREAATRAKRSTSWIREWIACGQLHAERRGGGRLYVDQADVDEIVAKTARRRPRLPVPYLRLVVDNTQ